MDAKSILDKKGRDVVTVSVDVTVGDALALFAEKNVGALIVLDENSNVVGIISERDILRLAHRKQCNIMDIPVREVMTKELIIAVPDDDSEYLKCLITDNKIRHLPVMDQGKLAGVISIGDVLWHQTEHINVENRYLKDYIAGNYPG